MIMHGERVLDAGAVFCRTADGKKIRYYDNGDHPRFPEYRSRAWDWYQTEYVIGGSAAFVFDVLAAEHVLTGK